MWCCVYLGGYSGYWSGNTIFSEVLTYNADTDQWEKIGDLATPRSRHGVSVVKWDDVAPFCY